MSNLDYKLHYRRNLPHIQPPGVTFFVTCRLAGSLPRTVLDTLREQEEHRQKAIVETVSVSDQPRLLYREQKRAFARLDAALDQATDGPTWLDEPHVATIVVESLHFLDGRQYELDVFCVMSNHLHFVFRPLPLEDGEFVALQRILHSLKRHTARQANRVLQRSGSFWQSESYDHFVRDERELNRIRRYVLNNPVKAGLVPDARAWPYSWAHWW